MQKLKIDPELRDLLPPLTEEEYKKLEKNIVTNGFDKNFPIMEWQGFIADGHNRYKICKEHNIDDYVIGTLAYKTKEEVIEWMIDVQLGRRNLSSIQRIAVAEKYRNIYEKQAKKNQRLAKGGDRRSENYQNQGSLNSSNLENKNKQLSQNSSTTVSKENKIDVRSKLAETAGVSTDTYSKGKKILDSGNEEIKQAVISGKMSINAGYNRIKEKEYKKENNNIPPTPASSAVSKKQSAESEVSEDVKAKNIKTNASYREVKEKEVKNNKQDNLPNDSYKDIANKYAGIQSSGHFGKYFDSDKTTDISFSEQDVINAYKDSKTPKNALDMLDIKDEFDTFRIALIEVINTYKNRLFSVYRIQEKISNEEKEYAVNTMSEIIENINKIIKKTKGE